MSTLSLLFCGDRRHIGEFLPLVPAEHTCFALDDGDELPDADASGRLRIFDGTTEPAVPFDVVIDLTCAYSLDKELSLEIIAGLLGPGTVVFTNALTMTATAASQLLGEDVPLMGIGFLPGVTAVSGTLEIAHALQADASRRQLLEERLRSICTSRVQIVQDRVGLVSPRILAMVINEAAFAVMEQVARAEDIDTAMKLGTNYPRGPLEWVDTIGADVIVDLLDALSGEYQEERYRACVLLRQYARARRSFLDTSV